MESLFSGGKQYCRLSNFLEEHHHDVYQLFNDTCLFSALNPRGKGMTFLLPGEAEVKTVRQLLDADKMDQAIETLKSCVIELYLPDAKAWDSNKSDIPNKCGKKVPVKKIDKGSVELDGAKLTLNKDFNYYTTGKEQVAVWDMDGFYSKSGGHSTRQHLRKHYKKRGARGGDGPEYGMGVSPSSIRCALFDRMVCNYIKYLASPTTVANEALIMANNAVKYLTTYGHERVSSINGCDSAIVAHLLWYPCPVATFMAIVEPGREKLCNTPIPDSCIAEFASFACMARSTGQARSDFESFGGSSCPGTSVISQKTANFEAVHAKITKQLLNEMNIKSTSERLVELYSQFEKSNKFGDLSGVEPQAEHDFLYSGPIVDDRNRNKDRSELCCRKAFNDETFYLCAELDLLEREAALRSSTGNIDQVVAEVHNFFDMLKRRNHRPYSKAGILDASLWKGCACLPQIDKFVCGPCTFIATLSLMHEKLPRSIIDARDQSKLEGMIPQAAVHLYNLDKRAWEKLDKIPDVSVENSEDIRCKVARDLGL